MPAMSTRSIISLSILFGLCATGCPESKTDTAAEPKSPDESAGAAVAATADEGATDDGKDDGDEGDEGDEKDEQGGW
jgi:hypothetical protein